jgi:hypothetical protein
MKACKIPVFTFLLTSLAFARNCQIKWYIIASGGGHYAHSKKECKNVWDNPRRYKKILN